MGIGYGVSISSLDDEFIKHVDSAVHSVFHSGGPAAMLVDFFPIRKSLRTQQWRAQSEYNCSEVPSGMDAGSGLQASS